LGILRSSSFDDWTGEVGLPRRKFWQPDLLIIRPVPEDLGRWSLGIEILRVPILKDFKFSKFVY